MRGSRPLRRLRRQAWPAVRRGAALSHQGIGLSGWLLVLFGILFVLLMISLAGLVALFLSLGLAKQQHRWPGRYPSPRPTAPSKYCLASSQAAIPQIEPISRPRKSSAAM